MKSNLHKNIFSLVRELYPKESIIEEKAIKVGGGTLFIDIFLPRLNIAIECDGIQHDKFSKFYHADIYSFNKQKKNDSIKQQYCDDNNITLVRIGHKDKLTLELISSKIIAALRNK